jgi:hypothetical protein
MLICVGIHCFVNINDDVHGTIFVYLFVVLVTGSMSLSNCSSR